MSEVKGLRQAGNIDLKSRPIVKNADGTISTVRSMSFEEDGMEVLVPTVSDDGRILGDDEAIALYHSSGKHLGKFERPEDASAYAEQLHDDQAKLYGEEEQSAAWTGFNLPDAGKLPGNRSNGPETWAEAFGNSVDASREVGQVIENTYASQTAMERAYDARIARIKEITGTELRNPLRDMSDEEMAAITQTQILLGEAGGDFVTGDWIRPDYAGSKQEEFNKQAEVLAERFPAIRPIISTDIMEDRNKLMRDAQKANTDAANSPELGVAGRFAAQMFGGLQAAASDPAQWRMAMLGAGGAAGQTVAGRIGKTIVTEALLNGGQELVLQGVSQERKRQAGLEHGMTDMLTNAGVAAVFGSLFGGTIQGGKELARIYKMGKGGEEAAARVLDGNPQPGDVETVAQAMGVELTPEKLDLINRSFEERVLDDYMVPEDATPGQIEVMQAAERYAADPDNHPPPDVVERIIAEREAGQLLTMTPDDYERIYAGDQNAIDDIADTFFGDQTRVDENSLAEAVAIENGSKPRAEGVADEGVGATDGEAVEIKLRQAALPDFEGEAGPGSRVYYEIEKNGVNEGEVWGRVDGDTLYLDGIRAWNDKPNSFGTAGMRGILRQFKAENPGVKIINADRISGARTGGRFSPGEGVDISVPIERQSIRPAEAFEPLDDAAMINAEARAGEILEPARDQNGNPENYLDFIAIEDGDGKVQIVSVREALELADEPQMLAELLEACKL